MHVAVYLDYYEPEAEMMGEMLGVNPDRVEVSHPLIVGSRAAEFFGHRGWNIHLSPPRNQVATVLYWTTGDGRGLVEVALELGLPPDEIVLGPLRTQKQVCLSTGEFVTYYYQSVYRLE